MKRNNIILAGVLLAVFILGLVGVALANPQIIETGKEDRLAGVLVTTESLDLFDFESYLSDNAGKIAGGREATDDGSYDGRIYAVLEEEEIMNKNTGESFTHQKYAFGYIDGFSYFTARIQDGESYYTATYGDEIFTDGNTSLKTTDEGNIIEIEGTIYILPGVSNVFYMNPVYQSDNGDIYVMQGTGISGSMGTEGSAMTQTLDASYAVTEDGITKTDSISVKISVNVMYEPVSIEIVEFDENSEIVARNEYSPGEVPKSIEPMPGTEYIVVTTRKSDPQGRNAFSGEIYTTTDRSMNTFYAGDDGICRGQYTVLEWD